MKHQPKQEDEPSVLTHVSFYVEHIGGKLCITHLDVYLPTCVRVRVSVWSSVLLSSLLPSVIAGTVPWGHEMTA